MSSKVTYKNPAASPPSGMYSHISIAESGRIAHIAGQTSVDNVGHPVAPGDIDRQAEQVFANIETVLKDLGAGFSDVLAYTTYVVGKEHQAGWYDARKRIFERIYPDRKYPPNTFLIISGLAREEFVLEIALTVRLPD
ncbi:MAG: hypothetical protein RLZ98_659 [Pseudomonadota bacterium]|jgi:enamine deaminase RidA (YjgF/YER057c/UK114 family)